MTKAVVTTVSECRSPDIKVSSFYDFWGLVHNEGFPTVIEFGKLDSYGLTTPQLVRDIIERDIDSRFMVIPAAYSGVNIIFNEELGPDAEELKEFFLRYLDFRNSYKATTKKKKGADIAPGSIPLA